MTSKEALEEIKNWVEYFTRLDYVDPIVRGEVRQNFKNAYWGTLEHFKTIEKDLDKLEQLEKIEEEFGIDFITLFKALKNGIWTNQEQYYGDEEQGKIRYFEAMLLLDEKAMGCIHNSLFKGKENIRTLYFKDYGKTWALTKEELENDK